MTIQVVIVDIYRSILEFAKLLTIMNEELISCEFIQVVNLILFAVTMIVCDNEYMHAFYTNILRLLQENLSKRLESGKCI